MQILLSESEEFGKTIGLGIFKGKVINLNKYVLNKPLPHVGLNEVKFVNNMSNNIYYFDHSYKVTIDEDIEKKSIGKTTYDNHEFISFFKKNNVTAVQFHPELSGKSGTTFLTQYFNDGE